MIETIGTLAVLLGIAVAGFALLLNYPRVIRWLTDSDASRRDMKTNDE